MKSFENLTVLEKSAEALEKWDAFVAASPQGSVFALSGYQDAIGANYEIVVHENSGEIQAGALLPKDELKMYSNPLYSKYSGILFTEAEGAKASSLNSRKISLTEQFLPLFDTLRGFDYTFHPRMDNWIAFYWGGYAQETRYTYIMRKDRAADWLSKAEGNVRRAIKKAKKENLTVEIVDVFEPVAIGQAYLLNMAPYLSRGQRPLMSKEKFSSFTRKLLELGMMKLFFVRGTNGEYLCSCVLIEDNKSVYLLQNGTAENAPYYANRLLVAEMIEYAHKSDRDFDFEGSMIRPIEKFYRDFNPELVSYYKIWKPSLLRTFKSVGVKTAKKILGYNR